MSFITIYHREGELTIRTNQIDHIEKSNATEKKMLGGEADGTIIPFPNIFCVRAKIYGLFEEEYKNFYLNEEQYISLLKELKTATGETKQ